MFQQNYFQICIQ